tara:strand:- start:347 stop:730 length:384 start_codon:yes stop_codon:yes gene_type:complete
MKLNRLKSIINEELKRLKEQQSNLRPGKYTHPLADTAGKSLTFTVTSKEGRPYMVGQGHREYETMMGHVRDSNMEKLHAPKDIGGGGHVSACTRDHGCCDWSIPALEYIYGIKVEWVACCYSSLFNC